MKSVALFPLILALSGCAGLDQAMSMTNGVLDQTGDVLSGDFRGLAEARETTLTEIWRDWQTNEVTAKEKWDAQTLIIPGVVQRITKTGTAVGQNQIAVIFSDPSNPKCTGQGLTRDDLLVNKKKISSFKKGDRVLLKGVLGTSESKWTDNDACWLSFDKAEFTLQK
ncbi:hypothetical protein [Pseudomonas amygdali]|uniref:hypothetical protein n=1 Tax=Pseudomonas amygdali TaxID=47877 RepID=UPI0006B8A7E2|nr:hypothetical protein [Pseudomonas amygdali]KPB13137.1 putative lipoprotein [Pseudomonas amygdali pv. sesami]KPY63807.1 putative lipoprotein [Pseudomonas amygdali pv. sesami]RMT95347.1 putative lipoprotein [Pseudomonas amygdali pv. sesami]RMT99235.1 putative lipoprotein [Pseudomonas amygdali pv. sesami]RMV81067.1 putative lipoprotein [Pseudomonas amygdali pv. sesami]